MSTTTDSSQFDPSTHDADLLPSRELHPSGPRAGSILLTRSLLTRLTPMTASDYGFSTPSSVTSRSRRTSEANGNTSAPHTPASRKASDSMQRRDGEDGEGEGEVEPPPMPKNWEELNEMIKELHRNQLWFLYVFSSAREAFQNGAQQQAEEVQQTLDSLSLALDTSHAARRRMLNIQRRVDAIKTKVNGWKMQQEEEKEKSAKNGDEAGGEEEKVSDSTNQDDNTIAAEDEEAP